MSDFISFDYHPVKGHGETTNCLPEKKEDDKTWKGKSGTETWGQ